MATCTHNGLHRARGLRAIAHRVTGEPPYWAATLSPIAGYETPTSRLRASRRVEYRARSAERALPFSPPVTTDGKRHDDCAAQRARRSRQEAYRSACV